MNRQEAESAGYTVDTTCYPWVAYKGPRFAPTEMREVYTDKEAELLKALEAAHGCLEYCGWGDAWERECARDSGDVKLIEDAIAKYGSES